MIVSHLLETAEFAISRDIQDEPAFVWWVENTIKTRKRIIDKVKSRYWKQTHKFGIEVPKSVEEAFILDQKNGNDYWQRAIDKEMMTVRKNSFKKYEDAHGYSPTAQEVRDNPKRYLVGYKEITCHIIFDIKLDGKFTRKARFVADGSKTDWPKSMTYSSVVSRESVRIAFLTAGLNDVDISACDISGAYLNAPAGEKVWFLAGRECGGDKDKVMVVVRALYGLKSSAKAWRNFFAKSLDDLGYKSCPANPDVYMKPEAKADGSTYYSYLLVYVDDCLLIHHDPKIIMERLKKSYDLKGDAYGRPDRYLGANVKRYQFRDGSEHWVMGLYDYVRETTKMVKE